MNTETFFLTGLDEHGQKVQEAAAKLGIDPKKHCDRMAPRFTIYGRSYTSQMMTLLEQLKKGIKKS